MPAAALGQAERHFGIRLAGHHALGQAKAELRHGILRQGDMAGDLGRRHGFEAGEQRGQGGGGLGQCGWAAVGCHGRSAKPAALPGAASELAVEFPPDPTFAVAPDADPPWCPRLAPKVAMDQHRRAPRRKAGPARGAGVCGPVCAEGLRLMVCACPELAPRRQKPGTGPGTPG